MTDHINASRDRRHGWTWLIASWTLIGVAWLILFPWLGRQDGLRRDMQQLDRSGVNAGALYYTDLKMLPGLLHRLDELHRRHPAVFWTPGPDPSPGSPAIPQNPCP